VIIFDDQTVTVVTDGQRREYDIDTPEGFEIVSRLWLRSGWGNKYVYSFTWLGRPMIQLPEDLVRLQELIYRIKPDVIVETGVAHGGGLVFYAGLCALIGKGRVIGVDIEIRPHNRSAIQEHPLSHLITLVEGSSTAPDIVQQVKSLVGSNQTVMVFLDSNHSKAHVLAELECYGPLVSVGSYIVAMDGIMGDLVGAPRSEADWGKNNPREAARQWLLDHPEFRMDEPSFQFNEGKVTQRVTYWPDAFLLRTS
jgi:cephalosporin hydroxylase